jgi:hypothetical protein
MGLLLLIAKNPKLVLTIKSESLTLLLHNADVSVSCGFASILG